MKITILAVGTKMPRWVDEAYNDYAKRFGRDISLELKEIKPESVVVASRRKKASLPSTNG
jgi:23S rRNA pseudoU1915 N3-methylase RlmH